MRLFTIGFTKKSAETFFTKLRTSGAKRVVDVRLNNVSQLAGFAKKDDLRFFLLSICQMDYVHIPALAPTQAMLDGYKKAKGDWNAYEREFLTLMRTREIEKTVSAGLIADGCLLCSEHTPDHCHRRLVAGPYETTGAIWTSSTLSSPKFRLMIVEAAARGIVATPPVGLQEKAGLGVVAGTGGPTTDRA